MYAYSLNEEDHKDDLLQSHEIFINELILQMCMIYRKEYRSK